MAWALIYVGDMCDMCENRQELDLTRVGIVPDFYDKGRER